MKWRLHITPRVQEALRTFPPETKRYIRQALDDLRMDPFSGKSLRDEVAGFYSFRTKRFRIIYQIQRATVTVMVIAIGRRDTIYEELTAGILSG